jgi:Winged helix DNA-binding domain
VEVLDRDTLNRATLERQLLLRRDVRSALAGIEHLVALQAQEPTEPYVGLWSRLRHFKPTELVDLLQGRQAVRTLLLRRTLHLVSRTDCLALRPVHDAMLVTRMRGTLGPRLAGVDFDELAAAGEPLFAEQPRTLTEVGRAVTSRWPGAAVRDLGDALSTLVPLVQTPPRGLWGQRAPARNTTITSWLGRVPAAPDGVLADLVLRYLRAYGPASSSDVRAWSGLSGLPAVIKTLRPQLRSYRDERGRELLDLAEATIPAAGIPAPVRFLPAFDNAVLGYDDRSRVIDTEHRGLSVAGARVVLVDGRVSATWQPIPTVQGVRVAVQPLRRLGPSEVDQVRAEATELARFLGDGAAGQVVIH